jgi:hypothetical protein
MTSRVAKSTIAEVTMIEITRNDEPGYLEVALSGELTETDYTSVLDPAIERALESADRLRVLIVVAETLKGVTPGAMLEDSRLGLRHWRGFDRIAIAADQTWLSGAVRAFAILVPCPVRVFPRSEVDAARRWLRESLGTIHQVDLGDGILQVRLIGQLDSAAYSEESEDLNAFIRAHDRFRLLIDLREFEGWHGVDAIADHLRLIRDHRSLVDRAAIVGNNAIHRLAEGIGSRFISGPTKYFDADDLAGAEAWLRAG